MRRVPGRGAGRGGPGGLLPGRGAARRAAGLAWRLVLLAGLSPAAQACQVEHTDEPTGREISSTDLNRQVTRVLAESAAGWNRGDLGTFMAAYLDSPTTTYWGARDLLQGYEAIRRHYAPRFAPGAERDSLRFEDVRARRLGADYALATARWTLARGDSVTASGPFSLVLRRMEGDWKIIHDHSSSFRPPGPDSAAGGGDAAGEAGATGG
ncbi:MAG TPA: AtzH-like domain-containing protein [Gemmatimonadota bacterium]|nr:AtzH-like domain-containing protein [Gemmatimonadota bacterium]